MIRINLMRNLGVVVAGPSGGTANSDFSITVSDIDRKQIALKLVIMLMAPGLLMAFEKITLDDKKLKLASMQKEIVEIDKQIRAFGGTGDEVAQFTEKKKEVEKSLASVKGLADLRLREVKTLDTIQTILPQGVWLDKISIEKGQVNIAGYSGTEEGLPELIRALETSVFFSSVEPRGATQETLAIGKVKKFDIDFKIGKAP